LIGVMLCAAVWASGMPMPLPAWLGLVLCATVFWFAYLPKHRRDAALNGGGVTYPRWVWASLVFFRFAKGYLRYAFTGATGSDYYYDMRRLFRLTNGRLNDAIARVHRIVKRPYLLPNRVGVLGDLTDDRLDPITAGLKRDGLFRFDARLSTDICARLRSWALRTPARPIPAPSTGDDRLIYDGANPVATKYMFDPQAVFENPDVQRLASDYSILSVAQAYFGCRPILTHYFMWWSTAHSTEPCDEAAQLFHYDMANIKFLKLFFYLTDVTPDTGPHSYVTGSHKRLPAALRDRDRRFSDDEIKQHYDSERIAEITGPTGTIFAADTRGLHKGCPLREGERLILQFQFSTCDLCFERIKIDLNDRFSPSFKEMVADYPYVYSRFTQPVNG
jgi:hypothetical protein